MPTPKYPAVNLRLMNTVKFSNQLPLEFTEDEELDENPVLQSSRIRCLSSFSWRASRQESFRTEMESLRARVREQPGTHFEVEIIG